MIGNGEKLCVYFLVEGIDLFKFDFILFFLGCICVIMECVCVVMKLDFGVYGFKD